MERIRPADLESPTLRTSFRGYEKQQVDDLMNRARAEMATMIGELSGAREEIDRLRGQLEVSKVQENAIKEALVTAQRAAEEVRTNAQREASSMVADARHRCEEIVREYESRISDLRWELERLRLERQKYIKDFTTLVESHLRSLNEESASLNDMAVIENHSEPHKPAEL